MAIGISVLSECSAIGKWEKLQYLTLQLSKRRTDAEGCCERKVVAVMQRALNNEDNKRREKGAHPCNLIEALGAGKLQIISDRLQRTLHFLDRLALDRQGVSQKGARILDWGPRDEDGDVAERRIEWG